MTCFKLTCIGGIVCATLLSSPNCYGENSEILWIEEDWEMVVNVPIAGNVSPQVTFFLTPDGQDQDTDTLSGITFVTPIGTTSACLDNWPAAVGDEASKTSIRAANTSSRCKYAANSIFV